MFIVRLFRWLCGYVEFEVTGNFVERFLNLAMRGGVNIWGLSHRTDKVIGCALLRDYKRFRKFTRKTGVRVRHIGTYGMPFVAKRYRKRVGILIGVAAFFVFLAVMSQFIWQIDPLLDRDQYPGEPRYHRNPGEGQSAGNVAAR